ncbi:hypothetical protein ABPG72_001097 [Tetrahymena utriculariae]
MQNVQAKRRSHPVWEYFKTIEKNNQVYVKCQLCKDELKHFSSSKPYITHINSKHKPEADLLIQKENEDLTKQTNIINYSFKIIPLTDLQKNRITIAIARFLFKDMKSLNTNESEGFLNIIKILEPRYTIPSSASFRNIYFPDLYSSMKSYAQKELQEQSGISITIDYWSNKSQKEFLTITSHFIDNQFQIRNYVISTEHETQEHTANNTQDLIEKCLSEFIDHKSLRFFGVTSDNAANMVKTTSLLEPTISINCFAPCLHNTLNDSLIGLQDLLDKWSVPDHQIFIC